VRKKILRNVCRYQRGIQKLSVLRFSHRTCNYKKYIYTVELHWLELEGAVNPNITGKKLTFLSEFLVKIGKMK
jgi:hypothetical protein